MHKKIIFITSLFFLQNLQSDPSNSLKIYIDNLKDIVPNQSEILEITQYAGLMFTGALLTSIGAWYCSKENKKNSPAKKFIIPGGFFLIGMGILFFSQKTNAAFVKK